MRWVRRSVCSIALLLECLDWKSDSFSYRTHLPFDSKVATLPLEHFERNADEAERLASDLIELSTRQNFAHLLAQGTILCGCARSAAGDTAQGISWIEGKRQAIRT
jgi:hypothetical protein